MKNYIVRLETVTTKKNSETKCKYKAELDLCDDMRFSEIMEFTDQVKMIWRKAMQASRRGDYMEMEVIEAAYAGRLDELKEELEQKNFDRWYFEGRNYEDTDGIYLQADTRYTPAQRDMYLTKDVLKDLCSTLG